MRKRQQKEKQSTRQIDESNINKMDNRSSSNSWETYGIETSSITYWNYKLDFG